MDKRIKVVQGGTWAGKTYGIESILISRGARDEGKKITVAGETIPAVKHGALADFQEIMFATNRWAQERYNSSERIYRFANKTSIEHTSFENIGKAMAAGKRDWLFINEGYYISFDIADALMTRTSGDIWIDYNPHSAFWVHDELLGRDDVCFLKLVPGDNEALPETIRQDHEIKREKAKTSEYWANWCRVFLDGEIGQTVGTIFQNWKYGAFDDSLAIKGFGLDFGFNNPDAFVKVAIDLREKRIYLDEKVYREGNSFDQLRQLVGQHATRNDLIIADCADQRMIDELRRYFNIKGVNKKKWTVGEVLKMLQDYEIIVTETSLNLVKELRNYVWSDKRAGIPVKAFDHAIDAFRYFFMENVRQKVAQVWHR